MQVLPNSSGNGKFQRIKNYAAFACCPPCAPSFFELFFLLFFFSPFYFFQNTSRNCKLFSRSGYFCLCNLFFSDFVSFWFGCSLFSSSCFLDKFNFAGKPCSPFLYVCEKEESEHLKCGILLFRLPVKASNCRDGNQSEMEKGNGILLWDLFWRNCKGVTVFFAP